MAKHNNSANGAQSGSFRDRASSAFGQFGGTASSQVDNSPLIALAGGIAVGALIAAILPQSNRETELLQPVGGKVTEAGRVQIDKVREAGKAKIDELAGDKLREFFNFGGSTGSTSA